MDANIHTNLTLGRPSISKAISDFLGDQRNLGTGVPQAVELETLDVRHAEGVTILEAHGVRGETRSL